MREKFPYNRWYFKSFKTFFNPRMRYTIKGFFVVNPCDWQVSVAVVTVFKDHFFISNWFLQLYDPRLHLFCSSGNKPLSIRNEYVYSVKTDVKILYFVVKQVIGRQFLGLLVSSDLGNKWVIQLTNHCGSCFGSVITSVNLVWVSWKTLSQKLGILSFPSDFHLLYFFRTCLTSSRVISLHSCYFRASYSLLSFSIHGALCSEFCYQTMLFPKKNVSLPQTVFYLSWFVIHQYFYRIASDCF